MTTKYFFSPFGTAVFPHYNAPDTKFNADGLYHGRLKVTGEDAEVFRAKVEKAAQEAFEELTADMTPKDKKAFSMYLPYEVEENDQGEATGAILFDHKQNAVIKLRDGTTKKVEIGLYDADDKPMKSAIWGGSEVRIKYSLRPILMKALKKAGVRLDFAAVQVRKLNTAGGGSGGGFGAIEGDDEAYREDASKSGFSSGGGGGGDNSPAAGDGDY